jgi:hypothetical protein
MGRAIPALLALVFCADIMARFLSVDPLTFRAWEAVSRYRPPGAAFEPNRRYIREQSYGDAAAMGNLPALRQYRPEAFTTDTRGFRNITSAGHSKVGAILAGESFAVGSGVVDEATLSATLSSRLGCGVYNAGGTPLDPDRLRGLAEDLGLLHGLVLHGYAEDAAPPTIPSSAKRAVNRHIADASPLLGRIAGLARGFVLVSPLQILSERAFKRISDDRILPNTYADNVIRATLTNGDSMLFVTSKVNHVRSERDASAASWMWLRSELHAVGLELFVVLIPSKYTVYGPLLAHRERARDNEMTFLDRLERELVASDVPVVNLTAALSREAADRARRHEYLYWRDDIHWNSEGIQFAASEILRHPAIGKVACGAHRTTAAVAQSPAADY